MPENKNIEKSGKPIERLKLVAQWLAVLVTGGFALAALIVICYLALSEPELIRAPLRDHLRAVVGLPMAGAAALSLVIILEVTSGNIEFEALGFKFKGASGPIVLWVFTFLAFVAALKMLW